MRVIGAGLGRTGTHSLKLALEELLGGPCYHMIEVFGRPDDIDVWQRAIDGEMPDWPAFLSDYHAAVDWPVAAFWRETSEAFPDALVLLSTRDPDSWWKSASNTIFLVRDQPIDDPTFARHRRMVDDMFARRFTPDWLDEQGAKAAYAAHNDEVRRTVPAERLLEWHPGDGWEPICNALGLPVPATPFPHVNTTDEFRVMLGLDDHGETAPARDR